MTRSILTPSIKFSQNFGVNIKNNWNKTKRDVLNNTLLLLNGTNSTNKIKTIAQNIQQELNDGNLDKSKITDFAKELTECGTSADKICELLENLIILAKHNNNDIFETKINWFGTVNKTSTMEVFLDTNLQNIAANLSKIDIDQSIINEANKALIESAVAEACKTSSSSFRLVNRENRLNAAQYYSKSAESYFSAAEKSEKAQSTLVEGLAKLANQQLIACSEMLPKKLEFEQDNEDGIQNTQVQNSAKNSQLSILEQTQKKDNEKNTENSPPPPPTIEQTQKKKKICKAQSIEIQKTLAYIKNVFLKNKDKITPEAFYSNMINIGKMLIGIPVNQESMEIRYTIIETLDSLNKEFKPNPHIPLSFSQFDNEIIHFIKDTLSNLNKVSLLGVDPDKLTCRHQHIMKADDQILLIKNYIIESYIKNFTNKVLPNFEIPPMSPQEQHLLYEMIKWSSENVFYDQREQQVNMAKQFRNKIYSIYRPTENTKIANPESDWLDDIEQKSVTCLNEGNFAYNTQFSQVGFKFNQDKVEFTMVHPLISFMLSYTTVAQMEHIATMDQLQFAEQDTNNLNQTNFRVLQQGYSEYNSNKLVIDAILLKIFNSAGQTLLISDPVKINECRNALVRDYSS